VSFDIESFDGIDLDRLEELDRGPAVTDDDPRRKAWLAERAGGIGGSDAASILNVVEMEGSSKLQVWSEKTGRVPPRDLSSREAVLWGRLHEPTIAAEFSRRTNMRYIERDPYDIIWSETNPFMFATVDRIISGADRSMWLDHNGMHNTFDDLEGDGILEIKTTDRYYAKLWAEEPPEYYQVQLQHYLAVTGLKWGVFAVLIGGNQLKWIFCLRNDRFIEWLVSEEEYFWNHNVLEDDPPVSTCIDHTTLATLFPVEREGKVVTLDGDEPWGIDRMLREVGSGMKVLKKADKELRARLKQLIGDAEVGVIPGVCAWTNLTTEAAGYIVDPHRYRALRRVNTN
jgi:putative phage-type endonuclease